MKTLILCYEKCSTCKKALKWLSEREIPYELRSITEENPTKEELTLWYQRSGLPLKKFFNTSGNLYKELKLKERIAKMTEEEQLLLLSANGMLVKRPMVVTDSFILTGFREEVWERAFQQN
ncbi:MAG: arsenate reductase family protein [Fusicatenibacter sp.]|nr:arsenate reductase family protein [Fusicatenibacter sp.]